MPGKEAVGTNSNTGNSTEYYFYCEDDEHSQTECGVFILGDIQNLTGQPEQATLADPALCKEQTRWSRWSADLSSKLNYSVIL